MKGLTYLIGSATLTATLFLNPTISYCSWADQFKRDTQKIEQDLNELKEDYNRTKEKIDGDNPQERGKKAAGWLLKNIYGIPGADKLIDILDRKQKEDNR